MGSDIEIKAMALSFAANASKLSECKERVNFAYRYLTDTLETKDKIELCDDLNELEPFLVALADKLVEIGFNKDCAANCINAVLEHINVCVIPNGFAVSNIYRFNIASKKLEK